MNGMKVSMLLAAALSCAPSLGHAAVTQAQQCEATVDKASARYAKCRLYVEAKAAMDSLAGTKLTEAFEKCSEKFSDAFSKALAKHGAGNCSTTAESDFEAYLDQCSDGVATAAGGGALPAVCGAPLLVTGQTTCWNEAGEVISCAGTGQDGESQTGVPFAYIDNGDGTITDSNTGLVWEKLSDDGSINDQDTTYNWTEALSVKIAALNSGAGYAGHSDWRLPNWRELGSIVNVENVNPSTSPAFNTGCVPNCTSLTCSCTKSSNYWSSSTYAVNPTHAWGVLFYDGNPSAVYKTGTYYVRAVRGGS